MLHCRFIETGGLVHKGDKLSSKRRPYVMILYFYILFPLLNSITPQTTNTSTNRSNNQ